MLTLNGACANIQPTRRPLFHAQNPPFYTPVSTAARRPFHRRFRHKCLWASPLTAGEYETQENGAGAPGVMGTNQE